MFVVQLLSSACANESNTLRMLNMLDEATQLQRAEEKVVHGVSCVQCKIRNALPLIDTNRDDPRSAGCLLLANWCTTQRRSSTRTTRQSTKWNNIGALEAWFADC